MKKVTLLFLFPLLCLGKSFGQCTPVDCSASLPEFGGVCDTVLMTSLVNQPYNESESFVITDNCFDAGMIDPSQAGNDIKITNVDNFSFSALPAGLIGATNAPSYSPPSGGIVVGCASVSGTPIQAGTFEFSIDFLADVQLCGFFPIPINDNAANYLIDLVILPDASFTGLASNYCSADAAVTLTPTSYPGGSFSGPGITNAAQGIFDPVAAGPGTHTITYTVSAQEGAAVDVATNSSSMTVTVGGAKTIYVDQSAAGSNDGSSWANAYTDLQAALAADAGSCGAKDIFIAEGTYIAGSARNSFFTISDNSTLYGGYAAGGGVVADPANTTTILSADVDGDGTLAGNAYHVVRAMNGANAGLNGLTITGGNANQDIVTQFSRSRGGGVFVSGANCTIENCIITGNSAGLGGGLFSTLSDDTSINNSRVENNDAERGAALYHSNETNMYIRKSRIRNNNSSNRCAIEINNSLYTRIENSVVANNASGNANAIGLIATNRDQTCEIINSTILGETKNKALFSMQIGFGDVLNVDVSNSIIGHQNNAFDKNIVVFNNNILNFNVSNSYFAGSSLSNLNGNGTNNIVETSILYAASAGDLMLNPNYSTNVCSPVVNAGDNAFVSLLSSTTDINGLPRIAQSTVDMGAYEKEGVCAGFAREVNNKIANITIYPNPANDIVNIQTDLEDFNVQIHDILGRTVSNSFNERIININTLPKGTYIMNIFQNGELKGTEKLMKH